MITISLSDDLAHWLEKHLQSINGSSDLLDQALAAAVLDKLQKESVTFLPPEWEGQDYWLNDQEKMLYDRPGLTEAEIRKVINDIMKLPER